MKQKATITAVLICINCMTASAQVNNTLSNLTAPTAVNAELLPDTNNTIDLGSATKGWKDLYINGDILHNGIRAVSIAANSSTFVGENAGSTSGIAINNSCFGTGAGKSNISGGYNAFFGTLSGTSNTWGMCNSFFGSGSGETTTTGVFNTFVGCSAGNSNTNGSANAFFGMNAGLNNTTANDNSFFGSKAGELNTTGTNNAFFGSDAGKSNLTAGNNSFFGASAGLANTGTQNAFFGTNAGAANTTANTNAFFGAFTGDVNTTGAGNAFFGAGAGGANTTASTNSFFGNLAGSANTTGGSNSFFGRNAGNTNTTGSTTTCIGFESDVSSAALTNATALGANANVNASNKVRIGNTTVTVIEGQVAYSFPSDGRFKTNVREDVIGLEFINRLRPVTYHFQTQKFDEFLHQNDPEFKEKMNSGNYTKSISVRQSGFIAQEVERAMNETGYDFNGIHHPESSADNYSMSYELMVVPLVKSVQELSAEDVRQKEEIENLKLEIGNLMACINSLCNSIHETEKKQSNEKPSAILYQNQPNPFSERTTIRCSLNNDFSSAKIIVRSLDGKMIMERLIKLTGENTIEIDAHALQPGTYTYTLEADGRIMDTKIMVMTR